MNDDLEQTTINPQGGYESAADAAPATSVRASEPGSRGGRVRWAIGLGVVALVAVATALAIGLLTGRAANAVVLGYVPSDSIMYGEARLDLPGDQRMAVGQFLSKFPGFDDQSQIETKVDELLDRLVGGATDGSQAFSSDIKPWFGGELAFSVGALPDPGIVTTDPTVPDSARFLFLVSVKDEIAAKAWFDAAVTSEGVTTSTETYGGASLTLFGPEGAQHGAYAVLDGKVAVLGDLASVRAAVDTKGSGAFGSGPALNTALDSTKGDHVGFVYVALRPLVDWSTKLGGEAVPGSAALTGLIPDWAAFALRVEGDGLVMQTLTEKPDAEDGEARTSAVADHVPGNALALGISHDYGKQLLKLLETYRSEPTFEPMLDSIDQALGALGGPDAALGWIGDVGIAVTPAESGLDGGLIIVPTERAAAERVFTSLRTLITLGGSQLGVSLRDEPYAGSVITIVDLGDVGDLAGNTGLPDLPAGSVPTGRVELAYAITDQVVVIGSASFVRLVLDTTVESSIASNDRYKSLAGRVGQGTAIGFADLTAIRELIEAALIEADAADRAEYETNVKPFLVPFEALIGSSSVEGEVSRSTLIVTVK